MIIIAWVLGLVLGALIMARINLGKLLGELKDQEHGAVLARNDDAKEIMVTYKADMARYRRVEDEA